MSGRFSAAQDSRKTRLKSARSQLASAAALATAWAGASVAAGQVTVTAPTATRIVDADANTVAPAFTIANGGGTAVALTATVMPSLGLSFVQQPSGTPILVSAGTPLSAAILADSSAALIASGDLGTAGDLATVATTVTAGGGSAINTSATFRLLDNRTLTGSLTVDAGRHMVSQSIGSLTLSGGSADDDHATRVTLVADGFADFGPGFRLTNASDFTFNGANQTHDVALRRTGSGTYSLTSYALPANNTHSNGTSAASDFGGDSFHNNALASAERLTNAKLDLSGVTLTLTGTSVYDRGLYVQGENPVLVRRVMQNGPEQSLAVDHTFTVATSGDDDRYTRLKLSGFSETADGLTASLESDAAFGAASSTAAVRVAGTLTYDKSSLGSKTRSFQLGNHISSLESLAGQTVQSNLPAYLAYNVLADNTVLASDAVVYTMDPAVKGLTFRNPTVRLQNGTDTHTKLTFTDTFALESNGAGSFTISKANGGIVGEGLDGEHVQDAPVTYGVTVVQLQHADVVGTSEQTELHNGDTFHLANTAGSSRASAELRFGLGGAAPLFRVGTLGGAPYPMAYGPRDVTLAPGGSLNWDVTFVGATGLTGGAFGKVFQAYLYAHQGESYATPDNAAVGPSGYSVHGLADTVSRVWTIEHTLAKVADAGTGTIGAGTDFGDGGVTLTSQRATTASLIDSLALDSDVTLGISFTDKNDAAAPGKGAAGAGSITGDVVSITGLDHVLHVVQIGAPQGGSQVAWLYKGGDGVEATNDDAWVNAVLGNHNVSGLDLAAGTLTLNGGATPVQIADYLASHEHVGSYGEYLLSLSDPSSPQLGAFGYDPTLNVAWAVIDHNSDFALVPEPASLALLSCAGLLLGRRRRRAV